ncbi:MAG: PilZ domain-containing protein [Proteobacteria bacterium]|nr:PilZ domain-containing protein [Pseudomonadota bacterium]
MGDQDLRQHPRLPVNLPATYCSANLIIDARVSNLSQAGLFLRCSAVDPIGTPAEVTISLPTQAVPLVVSGIVIWSCAMSDRPSGMGLHFGELSKETRAALANCLLQSSHGHVGV